jgi:hypothetical protein
VRRLTTVSALVAGIALIATPAVQAGIEGPCNATIGGVDAKTLGVGARDDAVAVPETSRIVVAMRSNRPIAALKVRMEVAGIGWTVFDEPTEGRSWEREIPMDDYATWGVGLFKVVATSAGTGFTCTASGLVDVEGSAVATVAGLAGLGLTIVGAIGVLVLIMRGGRAGGQPFAGILSGAALGIGIGTVLQQLGIIYPTMLVAIVIVAVGAAVGFLAGMVGFRPLE